MPVGTDIGNVYRGRQGTGLATIIDNSQYLQQQLYNERLAAQAKATKRAAADRAFTDYNGLDYFHAHHKEVSAIRDNVFDMATKLQEEGVDDPWSSPDPRAAEFRKVAQLGKDVAATSVKMREWHDKYLGIYSNKENQAKIKNWPEVKKWFYETSPTKATMEGLEIPELQFREPAFDALGETNKLSKSWLDINKKPMSEDEAISYAAEALSNPSYNEPGSYVAAIKQQYEGLMPQEQQKYIAKAQKLGNGNMSDQLKYFMADQLYNAAGFEVDLGKLMTDDASGIEVSKTDTGEETYTYVKGGEDVQVDKRMRSILTSNIGQIERDVKNGLYGDVNALPKDNFEAAMDYYDSIYRANIPREYKKDKGTAAERTEQEITESFDVWLEDLNAGRNNAAKFLFGSEDPLKRGLTEDAVIVPVGKEIKMPPNYFSFTKKPKKVTKDSYLVVDIKDKGKITDLQEAKLDDDQLKRLKEVSGKKEIAVYKIASENKEALRKIYRQGVLSQGRKYEREAVVDPLNILE